MMTRCALLKATTERIYSSSLNPERVTRHLADIIECFIKTVTKKKYLVWR